MTENEKAVRTLFANIKVAHERINELPFNWQDADVADPYTHYLFTKVFGDLADAYGRVSSFIELNYGDEDAVRSYTVENGRTHERIATRQAKLKENQ